MHKLITALLLMLLSTGVLSQGHGFTFTNYTINNGLADNAVQSALQDSRGFMWFGTREGLSRFDGSNFKNYISHRNDSNYLPGNYVTSLYEYKLFHLVFLSNASLYCLNTISGVFYQPPQFSTKKIMTITPNGDDGYFISLVDTCFVINKKLAITDTLVPPASVKKNFIAAFVLDKATWLIAGSGEFFLYNTALKKYTPFLLHLTTAPDKRIFKFHYYDPLRKEIYISNFWEGLYCFNLKGEVLNHWDAYAGSKSLSTNDINFVRPETDSIIWIGTVGAGLNLLNRMDGSAQVIKHDADDPASLAGNELLGDYIDHEKNEWFITSAGISRLSRPPASVAAFKKDKTGFPDAANIIGIVKGPGDRLFTAAFSSPGLCSMDIKGANFSLLQNNKLPYTWCINNWGSEIILTGNGTNVTYYDPVTNKLRYADFLKSYFTASDIVILAFKDSHGDEWYSGNKGGGFVRVSAVDKNLHAYKKDGPNGKFSISYYAAYAEDKKTDLWFGVNKSSLLLHWNRSTDQFNELSLDTVEGSKGVKLNGISELVADREGNIWVAFDGSGIIKYDIKQNRSVYYSIYDGLPTNYVYALEFDNKDRLWIGTLKGLSCLLPKENKFINFTKKNGLPEDYFGERCTYYDSTNNTMWIGSNGTIISFNPDELLGSTNTKLRVYIDEVIVNGKKYRGENNGTKIIFTPSENNFQFRFASVDLGNGNEIEYSYQLSGLNKEWMLNGTLSEAGFAELAAGDYTFTVRARHKGDNEWTAMQQPFVFTVDTPWFKMAWFKIIILLIAAMSLFAVIKIYLHQQLQKQKRLMEKELAVEQERIRMARELHDGLGSMLSGIKHSFSAIKNEISLSTAQQNKFDYTIDKLDDSIKDLRAVSHTMFSAELLEEGLEAAIRNYCTAVSTTADIKIAFENIMQQPTALKGEQAFHIFRVVQELVQNVVKHSKATEAIVQLSYNNGMLAVTVEDNGVGFNTSLHHSKNGIGLKNVESRIKMLHGKTDIQSQPGKGTSVFIEVPVK